MPEFKRDIQVADIHGCFRLMLKLIKEISFNPAQDHLTFLGDYIDRGPDSSAVIKYLEQMSKKYPENITLLMGNHEALAYEALREGSGANDGELWAFNGAGPTLDCYPSIQAADEHILPFVEKLELYYETDKHISVHAGLEPDLPLSQQPRHTMLWNRRFNPHCSGKTVVAGHTIHRKITRYPGYICIDTGAYRNKTLSAYDIITGAIYQVTE